METLQNAPARHGQAATKHPLVSVVMPAYNAEKYIGEAIRSVQSQTYDYDWLTSDLKISAGGSLRIAHNKIS